MIACTLRGALFGCLAFLLVGWGNFPLDLQQPFGGRFGPDFDPAEVERTAAGPARLGLACTSAYVDFDAIDRVGFVVVGVPAVHPIRRKP